MILNFHIKKLPYADINFIPKTLLECYVEKLRQL